MIINKRHGQNLSGRLSCIDAFFETQLKSFDNITSNLSLHFSLTFFFLLTESAYNLNLTVRCYKLEMLRTYLRILRC